MSRDPSAERPDVEPALDRELGWITFRLLGDDPAEREQPFRLCELLRRHGVRADVVEHVERIPVIELRGIPDLDLVERLVSEWRSRDEAGA